MEIEMDSRKSRAEAKYGMTDAKRRRALGVGSDVGYVVCSV
jgi:hypothetical protein